MDAADHARPDVLLGGLSDEITDRFPAGVAELSEQLTAVAKVRSYGGFGLLATVLASIGIYGVISFSVADRRQEIGIRMSLGARSTDVVWLVTREGALLTVLGFALGAPGVVAAARLVSTLLNGMSPLTRSPGADRPAALRQRSAGQPGAGLEGRPAATGSRTARGLKRSRSGRSPRPSAAAWAE